jgi:hypothetical protein
MNSNAASRKTRVARQERINKLFGKAKEGAEELSRRESDANEKGDINGSKKR